MNAAPEDFAPRSDVLAEHLRAAGGAIFHEPRPATSLWRISRNPRDETQV
jgi:hypothetical protein